MTRKIICLFCFLFFSKNTSFLAQEISYSNFNVVEQNDRVLVKWIIDSGSTCFGIEIQRSTDDLNFIKVGEIIGTCGSNSSSQSYSFFDQSPVSNSTNSYRLLFGGSQYSSSRQIFIRTIPENQILVYPNPVLDVITIEFNNEKSDEFGLVIEDFNGKTLYETTTKSDSVETTCSSLNSGVYWVVLKNETGIISRKRFLKTVKED